MSSVNLEGLTKIYSANGARAVDELTLQIQHGELIALLGPSGCGKTTTLRMIAGFLAPDAGTIRVGERVIAAPGVLVPPEKRNMSMIFQSYAIWPHKTVWENVAYGLKFRNIGRAEAETKIQRILAVVRMKELASRYPSELSGGQQQRVALARALVVEPEILLLDEPLSNLDANLREEMRFEIRRLHDEFHITSIYVTHDQSEAMVIADRICVMNQGRIAQIGTPQEVYEKPRTRFAASFIGKTNLLKGQIKDGNQLDLGEGLMMTIAGAKPASGEVLVSLRPHKVHLLPRGADATSLTSRGYCRYSGQISRGFYFGDAFEYQIKLGGRAGLRVIAPPSRPFAAGDDVEALIHPEDCTIVQDD